jgi:hypothetical protein
MWLRIIGFNFYVIYKEEIETFSFRIYPSRNYTTPDFLETPR